ncbi:mannosyl phosphorylinositol ceramide synthase CSH1 [Lingula anatina]|uniref:Mannosyl phosphorylinositol ceramide synthase CSH1 n=1 Tax=Lingula anatina TaxID=7574 RepID=A0A1S3JGN6_LINAN|nr:mannosyl phosphorylinositol ceramide synthase CSH1 [Lingula anatina]|eukprot:XP_013409523.1 mannosyl phosphorylinositol ceramide synthase CSH1 [Lingula anatina]
MRIRAYSVVLVIFVVAAGLLLLHTGTFLTVPSKSIIYTTEKTNQGNSQQLGIPKIIHQIWHDYRVPQNCVEWMKSWMQNHPSPEWEYWFWTKADWEYLIKTRFPNFYEHYHGFRGEIFRADIIRHFIMYEIGGIYVDLDIINLRTIDDFILNKSCVLSLEPYEHSFFLYEKPDGLVSTAILASRPRHPFFKKIVHEYQRISPQDERTEPDPVGVTGPVKFDRLYREYLKSNMTRYEDRIYLADPKYLMPSIDKGRISEIQVACEISNRKVTSTSEVVQTQELCKYLKKHSFRPPLPSTAYCDHLWIHTYLVGYHSGYSDVHNIASNISVQERLRDLL